jgi:undecaprenyl-diphosphatase
VRSKYRQEVLFAGYAALLGLGINFIITLFYFHHRPFMNPIGKLLIYHAPETSFPSDHTTLLFAISLMLLTSRELRIAGMVSLILSFIGGFARVYAGLHFPIDIAGSLLVALFSVGLLSISKKYLTPLNSVIIVYFDGIIKKCTEGR